MEQRVGIGSKAPFAYTDTFTVTNVYKNTKAVYIMSKEPNQAPTIKTIYSGITNEPSGLTVNVLITKINNYYDFRDKLNNFISKTDIKIKLNGVLQENNDFSNSYCFVKNNSNTLQLNVKYNSVTYKIDTTVFCPNTVLNTLLTDNNVFIFSDLILNAAPNTLDISATREALSYTKKTQDTLNTLCDNFVNHITRVIKDNIKDVYKDINTVQDYSEYIHKMSKFSSENTCISKDKDFIQHLSFYLTTNENNFRSYQKYNLELLNILNLHRKIMFCKIFNIKSLLLKKENLINSLIYTLFSNIIYTNTWNGKKSKDNYVVIPNKVYIVTNRSTSISREQNNVKIPVLLTSLKEKQSLIDKLTNFGFECVFVACLKKKKIIEGKKESVYGKLYDSDHFYDLELEPNSYITLRHSNSNLFHKGILNYIKQWSSETSIKIYELYNKKDFDFLKKQGHIDLEQEIESGEFIKKHYNMEFLKQSHIHLFFSGSYKIYDFNYFIENNNDNFELINNKKWKTFFVNYKKNFIGIKLYEYYVDYSSRYKNVIIDKKPSLAFNNLIAKTGLKNIIDYKKVKQYILDGKKNQVMHLLTLT
jgi:hypothetical protein